MASAMPELIFVAGPQQGERAVIMTNTAILGRSPNSDVRLVEEAASREHVRFQFTREGWVMENLSANSTLINGKRYKKNKKVVLDTGDVMGVGLETKILYVSPGDDPEASLQDWREANPTAQPKPAEPPAKARRGAPAATAPAKEEPASKADKQADGGPEEEGLGGPAEKGSKTLKVALLSVVLLGMVGFGTVLMMRRGWQTGAPSSHGNGVPRLTPEQISEALDAPLNRPPSPTQAAAALNAAVRSYTNKAVWGQGDLYRCVKQFKLYRAYSQSPGFPRIQYERMASAAAKELDALIRKQYSTAWKFEMAKRYSIARQSFEEFERLLPVGEVGRDSQVFKVIINNVRRHRTYIKKIDNR